MHTTDVRTRPAPGNLPPQQQQCCVPDSSLSRLEIPLKVSATHEFDYLDPMSFKNEELHRVLHSQVHPEAALHAFPRAQPTCCCSFPDAPWRRLHSCSAAARRSSALATRFSALAARSLACCSSPSLASARCSAACSSRCATRSCCDSAAVRAFRGAPASCRACEQQSEK